MSSSLILGLLMGLAVGGPLYYAYLSYTKKRRPAARKIMNVANNEDQLLMEEQKEQADQEVEKSTEEHEKLARREE